MVNHSAHTTREAGHPAAQRHMASPLLLLFAMLAGPAGWMLQLLVGFAVTSYLCVASVNLPDTDWLLPVLTSFTVIGLVLAAAGLSIAWALLSRTANEIGGHAGGSGDVLDIGEGRTRFMAMGGIFISLVSLVATLASTFSLFLVPLCRL